MAKISDNINIEQGIAYQTPEGIKEGHAEISPDFNMTIKYVNSDLNINKDLEISFNMDEGDIVDLYGERRYDLIPFKESDISGLSGVALLNKVRNSQVQIKKVMRGAPIVEGDLVTWNTESIDLTKYGYYSPIKSLLKYWSIYVDRTAESWGQLWGALLLTEYNKLDNVFEDTKREVNTKGSGEESLAHGHKISQKSADNTVDTRDLTSLKTDNTDVTVTQSRTENRTDDTLQTIGESGTEALTYNAETEGLTKSGGYVDTHKVTGYNEASALNTESQDLHESQGESESRVKSGGHTTTINKSGTTSNTGTVVNRITGNDITTNRGTTTNTDSGTDTIESERESEESHSGVDLTSTSNEGEESEVIKRHGNIGVTSSQQMISQEIELRLKNRLKDMILADFINRYTYY